MSRATVLLADDHRIVAQGLASLLQDDFDLVGTVSDGQALIEAARRLRPEVIVADLEMPVMGGLEAMRRLQTDGIDARVLILTAHADAQLAAEALRAGAAGFLLKHAAGEDLVTAIHEALEGRVYVTPLITRELLTTLTTPAVRPEEPSTRLTPRQRDVLRFIAQGLTMKEIAAELKLSRRTVETHKYEMMAALEMHSTAELIQYAIREGLVR